MKRSTKTGRYRQIPRLLGAAVLLLVLAAHPSWAMVTVSAVVDHQQVYVGESFTLQIQVAGDDSPQSPDLSTLTGFMVTPQGGQKNSSSSVSIINGHLSRVSHRGYLFNYALTPERAGHLTIPALEVKDGGANYFTLPITIIALPPQKSHDFKLRFSLAKKRCYIGEPIKLTLTWYIGKNVQGFDFNLPILTNKKFSIRPDPAAPNNANNDNLLTVPLGKGQVVAKKGNGILNGRNFLTVSFSQILVPLAPGRFTLPAATVAAKVQDSRGVHGNPYDPFSNFFNNNFFNQTLNTYRTVVVPSNSPELTVLPLPLKGRPANFSGMVGDYSLLVSASPTKVKVGDPITLTIQVAGNYAGNVKLPPLQSELPAADFKIPVEMAPGVGQGMLKTFTQTIRARHTGIKEIPPLTLNFFNSKSGKYAEARSKAVPLQVSANRIITAQDAEGEVDTGVTKESLHAAKGGINYNYETADVLLNQAGYLAEMPGRLLVVLFVGIPAALYGLWLLIIQIISLRRRNPARRNARKAYAALQKILHTLEDKKDNNYNRELLTEALLNYLRARLKLQAAVLTYADLEPILTKMGVGRQTMTKLRHILAQCEAGQYAGGVVGGQMENLLVMVDDVVMRLEGRRRRGES